MFKRFFPVIPSLVATCALLSGAASAQFTGVFTQHNDLSRTGQNINETTLTPTNVAATTAGVPNFGKEFSFAVDGQIYAQPLYVPNVSISGTTHNVVYVVTENDGVYAFDADGKTTTPLWYKSYINPTANPSVVPVPCGTDGSTTDISCNIFPYYGITGTPVIDPVTDTMYFVFRTQETPKGGTPVYYQRLRAVDITSGADKFGGPVAISGSVPGTGAGSSGGRVAFDPLADIQRVGLTLSNGNIFIGWAGAAHGWVMSYNATTLKQVGIFNTAPNAVLGGVWQTGNGFVGDASGNVFVAVGDATFDANVAGGVDYGDTVVKLTPSMTVVDYFTPMDESCRTFMTNDLDVGSAGPILLPPQGGAVTNELLVLAKSGWGITNESTCDSTDMYLLNADKLGEYSTTDSSVLEHIVDPPGDPNTANPQGFWSSGAFWQGTENAAGTSGTSYVYAAGTSANNGGNGGAPLDQYNIQGANSGTAQLTYTAASTNLFPQGSTPSVSSNGTTNGIVWAIERVDSLNLQPGDLPAILYAYQATNVATMLYNSSGTPNAERDQPGCANKFEVPTIANGRVYIGTQTELDVYGLNPPPASAPTVYLATPCYTWANPVPIGQKSQAQLVKIKNIGTSSLTLSQIKMSGINGGDFKLTNKCGKSLAPNATCNLSVTFSPTLGTPEIAYVSISDSAAGSPHQIRVVGTGDIPLVDVHPAYLAFGKQDIGIPSPSQAVTVANAGDLPVTVSSITFSGANANLFTETNNCTTIPVAQNCIINVTFDPQVTGQFTANLSINDNAALSPQVVNLTGVGVQPNAGISPTQINFGMVKVGSSSSPQPVTLTNTGGGTLVISSITFTGPNPGDYSQTNNCNGSVASQGSCTIQVTFKPTAQGTREAYLNINDNSVPSPQQASLSGDGT